MKPATASRKYLKPFLLAAFVVCAPDGLSAAPKAPAAPQAPSPAKTPKSGSIESAIKGDSGQDNLPMLIRSDSFQLDAKNRIFHYRDNVEVVKGDLTITADIMTGKYDESSQLREMIAENNVVVTRGDRLRATSNRAVYDIPKDTVVMTEGPELNDRGNVLDADKVTILVKEDRSFAEGHVRVKVTKGNEQNNLMKSMGGGGKKETPAAAATPSGETGEAPKAPAAPQAPSAPQSNGGT